MSDFFTARLSKSTYAVIALLVLVLIAVGGMDRETKRRRAQNRAFAAPPNPIGSMTILPGTERPDGGQEPEWARDPFVTAFAIPRTGVEGQVGAGGEVVPEPPLRLVLKGIARGAGTEVALINGQPMMVGDVAGGIRLVEIGDDYVIVSRHGTTLCLRLDGR